MAAVIAKSSVAAAVVRPARSAVRPCAALKPAVKAAPVAAPAQANKMMVWTPVNNKMFETFSYLPPLSDEQIAAQVDYIVANGWIPCLEFAEADKAYVSNESTVRFGPVSVLYYDNRYWTMWKLPMFGCRDPMQVLREIVACTKAFPDAYVRLVAFDNVKQVDFAARLRGAAMHVAACASGSALPAACTKPTQPMQFTQPWQRPRRAPRSSHRRPRRPRSPLHYGATGGGGGNGAALEW